MGGGASTAGSGGAGATGAGGRGRVVRRADRADRRAVAPMAAQAAREHRGTAERVEPERVAWASTHRLEPAAIPTARPQAEAAAAPARVERVDPQDQQGPVDLPVRQGPAELRAPRAQAARRDRRRRWCDRVRRNERRRGKRWLERGGRRRRSGRGRRSKWQCRNGRFEWRCGKRRRGRNGRLRRRRWKSGKQRLRRSGRDNGHVHFVRAGLDLPVRDVGSAVVRHESHAVQRFHLSAQHHLRKRQHLCLLSMATFRSTAPRVYAADGVTVPRWHPGAARSSPIQAARATRRRPRASAIARMARRTT